MPKMPKPSWIQTKLLVYAAMGALMLQISPSPLPARDAGVSVQTPPQARTQARQAHPNRPSSVARVRVVSELAIDRWLEPGEFAWNADGVPPGRVEIVVNLRARVLSVYRGGIEIGRSSVLYGTDNQPTPLGVFPILEKRANHVSNLYGAPMPHMMRLTWDGVALHGSQRLADDFATRGCVGLPRDFARLLFSVTRVGDRVTIWSGLPNQA